MKQRVISGAFILLITISVIVAGSYLLKTACVLINLYGSYEIVKCARGKSDWPICIVSAITSLLVYLFFDKALLFIIVDFLVLFTFPIFDEERKIDDLSLIFLITVILGCTTYFMVFTREISMPLLAYVFIICYLTDACAYFVGSFFGKHKLNERVSPKKSIEGSIGGFIGGMLISLLWAYLFDFFGVDKLIIIVSSILLPIVNQIGDLAYSLIKRHYGIKDFSNLIPGHGGLLDRLDSLTFVICLLGSLLYFVGR